MLRIRAAMLAGVLVVAALGVVPSARAWGPEGHALVADIAQARLDPSARREVARLLALDDDGAKTALDEISSWADAIRAQRRKTGPWHYVDIPLDADGYDAPRDCRRGRGRRHRDVTNCVVAKLPYFVAILRDRSRPDGERLEALKWVVHLTADIHQPLHDADDHDGGGNARVLYYNGARTNLHAVWDMGIIETHYHWRLGWNFSFDHDAVRAQAAALDRQITPAQRVAWAASNLVANIDAAAIAWANQGHALARQAYARLPANYPSGWDRAYQDWAWPVAREQLQQAGVRLAAVLNQSLD